jgi:homoserine O-acetyltransferase
VSFGIATAALLNYQKLAPTREQADKLVDARLASAMTADANDFLWQWGSSADYDAAPGLRKIEATVLASIPPMMSVIHRKPASLRKR